MALNVFILQKANGKRKQVVIGGRVAEDKTYDIANPAELRDAINEEYGLNDAKSVDLNRAVGGITDGNKPSKLKYMGKQVYHSSAGQKNTDNTYTIFWIQSPGIIEVFAVGRHESSSSYRVTHLANSSDLGDFKDKVGKVVTL